MDKVGSVLLAIVGMLAWMFLWMWGVITGSSFISSLALAVKGVVILLLTVAKNAYKVSRLWLKTAQHEAQTLRILTWAGAAGFAGATWLSQKQELKGG
jgi:hypothetical protein